MNLVISKYSSNRRLNVGFRDTFHDKDLAKYVAAKLMAVSSNVQVLEFNSSGLSDVSQESQAH